MEGEKKREYEPPKMEHLKGTAARVARNLVEENEKLEQASKIDTLTGLSNRGDLLDQAAKLISEFKKEGGPERERHLEHLTVMMLDIDGFKKINDTYGHPTGDLILKKVAEFLQQHVRTTDVVARYGNPEYSNVVARYGGEEFALIFPGATSEAIRKKFGADPSGQSPARIEIEIPEVITAEGKPLLITMSGGITDFQPEDKNIEPALKRADEALYIAKSAGKNQLLKYEEDMSPALEAAKRAKEFEKNQAA